MKYNTELKWVNIVQSSQNPYSNCLIKILLTYMILHSYFNFFCGIENHRFYDWKVSTKTENFWCNVVDVKVMEWKNIMFHHHILVFRKMSMKLKVKTKCRKILTKGFDLVNIFKKRQIIKKIVKWCSGYSYGITSFSRVGGFKSYTLCVRGV